MQHNKGKKDIDASQIKPLVSSNTYLPFAGQYLAEEVLAGTPMIITDPKGEVVKTLLSMGYDVKVYNLKTGETASISQVAIKSKPSEESNQKDAQDEKRKEK